MAKNNVRFAINLMKANVGVIGTGTYIYSYTVQYVVYNDFDRETSLGVAITLSKTRTIQSQFQSTKFLFEIILPDLHKQVFFYL